MQKQKEVKTIRLKELERKLAVAEKSEAYLEKELSRIMKTKADLRNKISKEKKAIYFTIRAKRLRVAKKKK